MGVLGSAVGLDGNHHTTPLAFAAKQV